MQTSLSGVEQYYEDSLVFVLDKTDYELGEILIESEHIKIKLPIYWKTEQYNNQLVLTCKKVCSDSVKFCPNISITKQELDSKQDFTEFVKSNLLILGHRLPNFETIKENAFEINGLSAYQVVYLTIINDLKLAGVTTWIKSNNKAYIITGFATNEITGDFLKYKGLFDEITQSFSICWVSS